ncbi:hypothetical protein [Burkholderia cenocepacia]|uniref:hypothetical protein n=1 Tax=Burkholderia cenocepacia TaxID=95486 RepID=UPI002AB7EECB|nr:hypothetical protein [Burkholderia cenocepacia]
MPRTLDSRDAASTHGEHQSLNANTPASVIPVCPTGRAILTQRAWLSLARKYMRSAQPAVQRTMPLWWGGIASPCARSAPAAPLMLARERVQFGFEVIRVPAMEYHVTYEYSLSDAPDDYIVTVPSQLVQEVPNNIPPVLLPEFIKNQILQRSPRIANIRRLQIVRPVSSLPQTE